MIANGCLGNKFVYSEISGRDEIFMVIPNTGSDRRIR
jgi:hypothetical protein